MVLRSQLFTGDSKLEAAAVSDPSHIEPGASGEYVKKIQMALNQIDDAGLRLDGSYGPATAAAVLAYKRKRNIVNRNYESEADNIVGKMTIAALDADLNEPGPPEISVVYGGRPSYARSVRQRPIMRLAFAFPRDLSNLAAAPPPFVPVLALTRWSPNTVGKIRCVQTAGYTTAVCTNDPDPSYDPAKPVRKKTAFMTDFDDPPAAVNQDNAPQDGGTVRLTKDPHFMRLEAFRPGDATITVRKADVARMLLVEVRQDAKGAVPGALLSKLRSGSKFFSAGSNEPHDPDPHNIFSGRPVNPKLGGRLINLGGETETPGFEDYQVDLIHSEGSKGGFRPWVDDPDPSVMIPGKSASHITMRGTPLFDSFVRVIKRIAQPGCRFTYSGATQYLANFPSQVPGKELENISDGTMQFGGAAVLFAYEIA